LCVKYVANMKKILFLLFGLLICVNSNAYAVILFGTTEGQDARLVTVDQETGNLTNIGPTFFGIVQRAVLGLAFSPDGILYGTTEGQDARLVTVNINTGALTNIGPTLFGDTKRAIDDIAFKPEAHTVIPEPSTFLLLSVGLLALALRRRHRQAY